jgi:hypothetical protein
LLFEQLLAGFEELIKQAPGVHSRVST